MSSTADFLSSILPSEEGVFFIASPFASGHGFKHFGFTDIEAAAEKALELAELGRDAYFACAQYGAIVYDNNGKDGAARYRVGDNAVRAKALWLDLDVDPSMPTKYASQAAAVEALQRFCKTVGLPRPTVVDSGYGVHVYWSLRTSLPKDRWLVAAAYLKAACAHEGLLADPTRTADICSVLRVPGTVNCKRGGQRAVRVFAGLQPARSQREVCGALEEFCQSKGLQPIVRTSPLPSLPGTAPSHRGETSGSQLAASLGGGILQEFDPVDIYGVARHCAQVKVIVETRGNVPEPIWYAGLGLAMFSADPTTAIHEMSDGHPGYSPAATEAKAQQWVDKVGTPPTCNAFYSANPAGCEGCPHRGTINTPARLARHVPAMVPLPPINLAPPPPPPSAAPMDTSKLSVEMETVFTTDGDVAGYIAVCPPGFRRATNGVEYLKPPKNKDDPEEWAKLSTGDFLPINTYKDHANSREQIVVACRQARDVAGEEDRWVFIDVPSNALADGSFVQYFYNGGMYLWGPGMTQTVGRYLVAYISQLKRALHTQDLRQQLGWADDDKTFVAGQSVYHADGSVGRTIPSETVKHSLTSYSSKGDADKWWEAFDAYARPGCESHAFAALTAFAAPLLHFTGYKGVILSLVGGSAAGKTTIQQVINAAWGHPEDTMLVLRDTPKAQMRRMALANHLPICVNEGTTVTAEQIANTAYAVSEGRFGRGLRANRQEMNEALTWETISIWSSNRSLTGLLGSLGGDTEAQALRIFEMTIPTGTLPKAEADRLFRPLLENYGHAGPEWARHLVHHRDTLAEDVRRTITELDADFGTGSQERYWVALVACVMVANQHLRKLGRSKISTGRLFSVARSIIGDSRVSLQAHRADTVGTLASFMAENASHFAAMRTSAGGIANTVQEYRGQFVGMIDLDKQTATVLAGPFRDYLYDRGLDYTSTLQDLIAKGVLLGMPSSRTVRTGSAVSMPRTMAFAMTLKGEAFGDLVATVSNAA